MASVTTLAGTYQPPISNQEYLRQKFGAVSSPEQMLQVEVGGAGNPLGIIGNFVSNPTVSGFAGVRSGKPAVVTRQDGQEFKNFEWRKKAYKLQEGIQSILRSETCFSEFKGLKACMHTTLPYIANVTITKDSVGVARYRGLVTCDNNWVCPICSARNAAKNAAKISRAINRAYSVLGLTVIMLTFTHQHYLGQPLAPQIEAHNMALRKFRGSRQYKRFVEDAGVIASFTAREVTHNDDGGGFNWHNHILLFCKSESIVRSSADVLSDLWVSKLQLSGMPCSNWDWVREHGLQIEYNMHSSEYLTKYGHYWGAEREVTKSWVKNGGGRHPFDLAFSAMEGNEADKKLFLEFVRATRGKVKYRFSPGFDKILGIDVDLDEGDDQSERTVVACLPLSAWALVVKYKARCELLELAELGGYEAVRLWFVRYDYVLPPPPLL